MQFIASLVGSLAWPVVAVYIIYLLKDRIADLLPRLKRFKHKDTELEFIEGVKELKKEAALQEQAPPISLPRQDQWSDQFTFLARLSEISSRAAVLEAWRILETSAARVAANAYPELDRTLVQSPVNLRKVLKDRVLDPHEWKQFDELRRLRNTAAHADEFDLRGMPIETYLDIALSLARRLDQHEP